MKQIPEFLLNLYTDTQKETRPFSKIFTFINLSEAVIKFYTVVTVQNFLETEEGNPSLEEGKAVLGKGLARPSLGLWAFFTERITELIPIDKFFWENFPEFFEKDLKPATAILVNLRNKYHHGAVPSNEDCTADFEIAMPYFTKILFEGYIGNDRILIGDIIKGSNAKEVFLERADGRKLELSPLLHAEYSSKSKKEELYYFNDAKNFEKKNINTVSYDIHENRSNKEIFEEFSKAFPIKDWEKTKYSRFANRIAELTENFQGRTTELSKIKTFLSESNQGFFFIWGGPGIGKSALIARSLVLVRAGLEEKTQVGETGFDLGTKDIIVLEYFIRRATITDKEDTFYSMLGEDLEGIFKTGISMGNNLQEKKEKWRARLEKIQRKLNGSENIGEDEDSEEAEKPKADSKKKSSEDSFVGKKLILCIDGLDEGEEGILRSIPRGSDLYSNILFVLGGRDVTQTRTLYTTLDADKKAEIVLHGLSETDIRAIMLNVSQSDYLTSEYIAKLLNVSEGNPLYLKMISDSIERGERQAGDLENLPAGVDNLYDGIYERFSKLKDSKILLKILYFFTFAKDFLSVDVVAYFLQLEYFRAEFLVGEIREVLWKDPQREEVDFLQLFHESLRDYLRKKYDGERFGIQKVILDGLQGWKSLCEEGIDPRTSRYILQYGVTHLLEEGEQKQAEKFVLYPEFVKYQVEYLNFYTVSLDDAVKVLDAIVEELGGKPGTTRPLEEIFKPKLEGEEFRTTTLVRLLNHAGELGNKAGTDIGIAWTWIEEGRVEEALERLSPIQDKQRLFDCYIFALWLLTLQEDGEQNRKNLGIVLYEIEKNIPPAESETVDWNKMYTYEFFSKICKVMIERDQKFRGILERCTTGEIGILEYFWLEYIKFEKDRELFFFYITKILPYNRSITKNPECANFLENIGEWVRIRGDVELGYNLFPILIKLTRSIKNVKDRSNLLMSISKKVSSMGDIAFAFRLFPMIIKVAREIRNSEYLSSSLVYIGECVDSMGNFRLALRIFHWLGELTGNINNPNDRINALCGIGIYTTQKVNVTYGRKLFMKSIELARGKSNLLKIIGEYVYKLGDVELACNLIQEMKEVAREIKDLNSRNNAFRDIVKSMCKLGEKTNTHILFLEAIDLVGEIEISESKIEALIYIGESVSSTGNVNFGIKLFKEAKANVFKLKDKYIRAYLLWYIVDSISKLGLIEYSLFQEAIKVANSIKSFSHYPISSLISIGESLIKLGDEELGCNLFPELIELTRGIKRSDDSSQLLINIGEWMSKLGDVVSSLSLLPVLVEVARGIKQDWSSAWLNNFGESMSKLGNLELSRSLLSVMVELSRGIERPLVRSGWLNSIGESVSKLGDVELGRSLFPVLVEVALGIKYSRDRSSSLISIGESVSKLGDVELGRSLFPVILEEARGIKKPWDCSSSLLIIGESISKLGDVELGRSLFPVLVEIARSIEDYKYRSSSLNSIGESVNKQGDVELSRSLFQEAVEAARGIKSSRDRSSSLISIGESVSIQGDVELGHNLFQEAVETALCIEDSYGRSSSLESIIESMCKLCELISDFNLLQKALEVTLGIENSYFRSSALNSISRSVGNLRNLDLVRKLFPELLVAHGIKYNDHHSTLFSLIQNFVKKIGKVELSSHLISNLLSLARGIEDSSDRFQFLCNIKDFTPISGNMDFGRSLIPLLVEVARSIEDSFSRSRALGSIGESISKLGDVELGRSLFQESVEVARGIDSSYSRSSSLSSIGESVSKLGDVELGRSLFPLLVEVARGIEDSYDRSSSLISIKESLIQLGDVELIGSLFPLLVEVARGIESSYSLSRSIGSIGESLIQLRDVELGRSLFPVLIDVARGIEDFEYRSKALISIGECVSHVEDVELGQSLFAESVNVARGIKDFTVCSILLISIGEIVYKLGDIELARSLFKEAIEYACGIEDFVISNISLSSIREFMINLGDVDLGRRLFPLLVNLAREIEYVDDCSATLNNIGEFVISLGDVKLASSLFPVLVELARGIEYSDYRIEAIRSIGESISKLGDVELGRSLFPILFRIARSIDDLGVCSSLSIIADSVSKLGDIDLARSLLLEATEEPTYAIDLLCNLGIVSIKMGDKDFGRKQFMIAIGQAEVRQDEDEDYENEDVYYNDLISISEYISQSEDLELGQSIFPELIKLANNIRSIEYSILVLNSIAESALKLGDLILGRSQYQRSFELAQSLKESFNRAKYLDISMRGLGKSKFSIQYLSQLFKMVYKMEKTSDRRDLLQTIAKIISAYGSTTAYSFFETNHESHSEIPEVIKAYTEEYRQINWEEPKSQALLPYYIRSFRWLPLEGELAKKGEYDMISTFAKMGKIEEALEAAVGIGMIDKKDLNPEKGDKT